MEWEHSAFFNTIVTGLYSVRMLTDKIAHIITPTLTDLGLWVVRVRMMGGTKNTTLQIMIDRLNGTCVDIQDCQQASYAISALMDVEDPIKNPYTLEVSTPGIDRPLVRLQDYKKYVGFDVKIELKSPTNTGRKRYRGVIDSTDNTTINIAFDTTTEAVAFDNILHAKLVLTEALMDFSQAEMHPINTENTGNTES